MGCCGGSSKAKKNKYLETNKNLSPLGHLKIRLAKGEVSYEEYEETKTVLSQ